jgi:hypothetical protein
LALAYLKIRRPPPCATQCSRPVSLRSSIAKPAPFHWQRARTASKPVRARAVLTCYEQADFEGKPARSRAIIATSCSSSARLRHQCCYVHDAATLPTRASLFEGLLAEPRLAATALKNACSQAVAPRRRKRRGQARGFVPNASGPSSKSPSTGSATARAKHHSTSPSKGPSSESSSGWQPATGPGRAASTTAGRPIALRNTVARLRRQ